MIVKHSTPHTEQRPALGRKAHLRAGPLQLYQDIPNVAPAKHITTILTLFHTFVNS